MIVLSTAKSSMGPLHTDQHQQTITKFITKSQTKPPLNHKPPLNTKTTKITKSQEIKTSLRTPVKIPLKTTTSTTPKRKIDECDLGEPNDSPMNSSKKTKVKQAKTTIMTRKLHLAKLHLDEGLEVPRGNISEEIEIDRHRNTSKPPKPKNQNDVQTKTKTPDPPQQPEPKSKHWKTSFKPKLPPETND